MGSELALTTGSDWRDRFDGTLVGFSTVMGKALRRNALEQATRIPSILTPDEQLRLFVQAHRKDEIAAPVLLILTDRRLLVVDDRTGQVLDNIHPSEVKLAPNGLTSMSSVLVAAAKKRAFGIEQEFEFGGERRRFFGLCPANQVDRLIRLVDGSHDPDRTSLLGDLPLDPGVPPISALWEIAVYPDRLIVDNQQHLPFGGDVTVTVDTAGAITTTRGRNLGQKAMGTLVLGPIGLFGMGNARVQHHDHRQLFLLVEGERWVYTKEFVPAVEQQLRQFAKTISIAATDFAATRSRKRSTFESDDEVWEPALQLRELARLHEEGLLTDDEFIVKKARILERM